MPEKDSPSSLCEENNEEWGHGAFPTHVRVNESVGGVCMWERTNSPTTHHFPTITVQITTKVFNLVVD